MKESNSSVESVKYIFVPHTERYVEKMIPNIDGADIVAYENFTDRRDARLLDAGFNKLGRGEAVDARHAEFFHLNTGFWIYEAAKLLQGQGKRFVSIDIYDEGEASRLFNEHVTRMTDLHQYLSDYGPPSIATKKYLKVAETLGAFTNIRDEVMASNLQKLIDDSPGTNIAVLLGAAHTQVARMVEHRAPIEKVYISHHPFARVAYEYGAEFSVARCFSFGKTVPEEMAHKALLQILINNTLNKDVDEPELFGTNRFSTQETARFIDQLERAAKKIGRDSQAEFRYRNTIIQAAKLAVKKLANI
jgi:hypothetical protein